MTILLVLRALLPPFFDIHLSDLLELDPVPLEGPGGRGWGAAGTTAGGTAHGPGTVGARGAAARTGG